MRLLILWPHPRRERVLREPEHEFMDGLSPLVKRGHTVRILDPFPFPLNPLAHRGSLWAGLDFLRFLRLLAGSRSFDAVVSIDAPSCLFFSIARRMLGLNKTVVVIDPALGDTYPRRKALQDVVLPRVDHVVVFGTVQRAYLESHYGDRVACTFVPHRMDTGFFDPAAVDPSEPTPFPGEYALSVGSDVSRDFPTLLAAFEQVPVRLVIRTRRAVRSDNPNVTALSEDLSFRGLRRLYHDARFVVLPLHDTIHAGGINTLLEAMSMGKGVIVTDSRGVQDYVVHGETAHVVRRNSPEALEAAIRHFIDNPDYVRELGVRARRFCVEQCALDLYADRIDAVLAGASANR